MHLQPLKIMKKKKKKNVVTKKMNVSCEGKIFLFNNFLKWKKKHKKKHDLQK